MAREGGRVSVIGMWFFWILVLYIFRVARSPLVKMNRSTRRLMVQKTCHFCQSVLNSLSNDKAGKDLFLGIVGIRSRFSAPRARALLLIRRHGPS